jgi:putative spermidine/putrescine transport system substrate-binding protein
VDGIDAALGGSDGGEKGLRYLQDLSANGAVAMRGDLLSAVIRGELPIWINTDALRGVAAREESATLGLVIPSEAEIRIPFAMALVKNGPHTAEAKRYLDFLLSRNAQDKFEAGGYRRVIPGAPRPDAPAPPREVIPPADLTPARADTVVARWRRAVKRSVF